jgi:hypothetical protein
MASIADYVLDAALSKLDLEANRLDITSQEVTTYNEAISTYTLGNTTSVSFGTPVNGDVSGRKTTCAAVTDGSVTGNGTATHYAVTDTTNSRLLCTGSLSTSQSVVSGNTFTISAFDVEIPDPA